MSITKRITFGILFVRTFIKKNAKVLSGGIFLGFLLTTILLLARPLYQPILFPNVQTIGIVGNITINSLPQSVLHKLSIGLTSLDEDGTAKPALATHWVATDSGKRYIFYIRKDAYWHDGTKVSANDINYKLKDAALTPIDDLTLQIDVKDSFSPLTTVLARPVLKDKIIGVGVYKVINTRYKGDKLSSLELSPTKPNLPKLIYKFYPNLDDAILAFKSGEVQKLEGIPSADALSSWKNVKITEEVQRDRFLGVFFNMQKDEFKDKEIRQALSFAVPPFEAHEKLFTPLSSQSWAYYDKVRIYKYDPEHAKEMLKDSKLATSSAEITLSTYPIYLPIAQKIADSWQDVGVKTKIKVERSLPSDYQALLIAQEVPSDPDQYQYWHSNQKTTNLSHYASQKIDKLLEDGRKTLDIDERKKIYIDFQRYLVDDAPVAFLFFPRVYSVERK